MQQFKLLLFILIIGTAYGQDERYYRQILNGELPQMGLENFEIKEEKFSVEGSSYLVDLNDDGIEEILVPKKRDGVDWIEIKDSSQRTFFEGKLLAQGGSSTLYKIKIAHLSNTVKVLLLFMDEGKTAGQRFESTGRIFLIPYENNKLENMKVTQGPHHFHEKERQREQYWRRDYAVEIRDVNNDGIRDIIVSYNHIQRILLYKGKGEWTRL